MAPILAFEISSYLSRIGWAGQIPTPSRASLQALHEARSADGVEGDDGGDVQRLHQRLLHRHRAAGEAIEVHWHPVAEAGGAILDQAFGVGEAELEGEAVDQRLQSGAGRAHGRCHVDEACRLVLEEAGGTD